VQETGVGLGELARLFLKLGTIGFGGPAAHIALMQDEVVARRRWLGEQDFLDLIGVTNLIPGPNSTEMAILIGRRMRGLKGLLVSGLAFIVPAATIVLLLAVTYVEYGSTPRFRDVLYGVIPVIIAVIVHALSRLARTAVKKVFLGVLAAAAFTSFLAGVNELVLLAAGGLIAMLVANRHRLPAVGSFLPWLPALFLGAPVAEGALDRLFLTFLKIGAVLYGSGYVLVAFLRRDFVVQLEWLTNEQLLDAVAIGQFTPGPVFTTATFVGYFVAGFPGAVLATVAIFLPAFVFAVAGHRLLERLEGSSWVRGFLDGLNAVAVALIAGVLVELADAAWVDAPSVMLSVAALVVLLVWRVNSAFLVAAGALLGLAHGLI
jgi:chromate transporter